MFTMNEQPSTVSAKIIALGALPCRLLRRLAPLATATFPLMALSVGASGVLEDCPVARLDLLDDVQDQAALRTWWRNVVPEPMPEPSPGWLCSPAQAQLLLAYQQQSGQWSRYWSAAPLSAATHLIIDPCDSAAALTQAVMAELLHLQSGDAAAILQVHLPLPRDLRGPLGKHRREAQRVQAVLDQLQTASVWPPGAGVAWLLGGPGLPQAWGEVEQLLARLVLAGDVNPLSPWPNWLVDAAAGNLGQQGSPPPPLLGTYRCVSGRRGHAPPPLQDLPTLGQGRMPIHLWNATRHGANAWNAPSDWRDAQTVGQPHWSIQSIEQAPADRWTISRFTFPLPPDVLRDLLPPISALADV